MMIRRFIGVFDGKVLRPETSLDLEANGRYHVTITPVTPGDDQGDLWDFLESVAGTVDAPPDWAAEHDHYLYGTPKRDDKPEA